MAESPPEKRKLHHYTPLWVPRCSRFHIRIRCHRSQTPLIEPGLAAALLKSVDFYQAQGRWWCYVFLLMPDHIHALIVFPPGVRMSRVIGDWKHYHVRQNRIAWQEGYFDHRIRNDHQFAFKAAYIRANPVVKGLCTCATDWPWVYSIGEIGRGGPCAPRAASEIAEQLDPKPSRAERPTHLP